MIDMSVLDKKIGELEKDEEGNIDIPLEPGVIDAVTEMIQQFDASEFGNAFKRVDVESLSVSKEGLADVCVHVNGCQCTYHRIFDGDYWNPPEDDVREDTVDEHLDIEAEGITDDMTVADVIRCLGDAAYDDKEFSKELYEMTRDINGDEYDE